MTAVVGALLCLYLLAWWWHENRYLPAKALRAECERVGHKWGEIQRNHHGDVWRDCTHCKRQEHRWPDGTWPTDE